MSWLAPLGFIGLIGIVALIVIYIIKPNYQQKVITSTFVWRRSLKFRKKKLPVSKLQNLLIFLCQLLILTTLGLLLARPVVMNEKIGDENEKIIIIDASASMLIEEQGSTRFARAIDEAKLLVSATYEQGGVVSVILADDTPFTANGVKLFGNKTARYYSVTVHHIAKRSKGHPFVIGGHTHAFSVSAARDTQHHRFIFSALV